MKEVRVFVTTPVRLIPIKEQMWTTMMQKDLCDKVKLERSTEAEMLI